MEAIETRFSGRVFRSRLEATWAAFFDSLGWQWEYEPFDLNGWFPDFLICGTEEPILVEVKPIATFDTARENITDATLANKLECAAKATGQTLLICGCGPVKCDIHYQPTTKSSIVGWLAENYRPQDVGNASYCWQQALLLNTDNQIGLTACNMSTPTELIWNKMDRAHAMTSKSINDLWGKAKSQVQWKPRMAARK